MALYLLDTDAIIDYLADISSSADLIEDIHRRDTLCTCDIVIAEVYSGLRPDARGKAEELLERLKFLPTSTEAAIQAGRWRYDYARQGITLSITDALIAAAAHAYDASIVTGNGDDYPMEEISIVPLPRSRKTNK